MGNSLIFPVPKCNYSTASLQPFYHSIPVTEEHYSNRIASTRAIKRSIPSLLIKSSTKSKYLIIYFHGNGDDLGRMFPRLLEYYENFQIDILAAEYPGYGIYKGQPSAARMILDSQHIIDYVTRSDGLNYPIENIILVGRSLGTGVAIQLGVRYPTLKGVVLISAFTSIRDIANSVAGAISKLIIPDIFQSHDIIAELNVPALFIHGIKDDVIPYSHAIKLYEKCGSSKKHLELREGMDHNRCKIEKDIFTPIEKFFTEKLQIADLDSSVSKPLSFEQAFGEDDITKPRSYTISSRLSMAPNSQLKIRISESESLPTESNMLSQSVPLETWKGKLQATRPISKRFDSDIPFIGSIFKCPI